MHALTMCAACHAGPMGDMHEALVLMCSRVLTDAGTDRPRQAQVMRSVQRDAWLLRWYAVQLLRNVSYDIADAAFQVGLSCWRALAGRDLVQREDLCARSRVPQTNRPALGPPANAMQGARESFRSHWGTLTRLVRVWDQLRREIAGVIAAHSQLQGAWVGRTCSWRLLHLEGSHAWAARSPAACPADPPGAHT